MPPERPRLRTPAKPALDLPPPFRLVSLREVGDSFAHAMRVAPREGAGTLVHVGRFDLAEFAVVLEPEEPLRSARRALYAGLAALADALAVHAPPERALTLDWPDAVRIESGLVGGARLGWPPRASEDKPPDWLVFAAMIRTVAIGEEEPGLRPLSSALDEEGFDTLVSDRLVESFARHFMTAIDTWQAHGFTERRAISRGLRRRPECGATSRRTGTSWCAARARGSRSGSPSSARCAGRPGSIPQPD
jgi:Biotin/lipoate A/B protein ligase family